MATLPRRERGAVLRRRLRRLAVAVTPLVATIVTAAPAIARPEGGW